MSGQKPTGPFCQSCGMPMVKPEDFGTDGTGRRINDFCRYCYANGAFTDPALTMPEMIDRCVTIMTGSMGMPEAGARALLADVMPTLKRWQTPAMARSDVPGGRGLSAGDEIC